MKLLRVIPLVLAACTGQIGPSFVPSTGGGESPSDTATGNGGRPDSAAPGQGGGGAASAPSRFGAAAASLKRLRLIEYQNSVRDLLGPEVVIPNDLEGDLARGGFTSISAAIDPFSSGGIEKFESAAYNLAAQVFAAPAIADRVVGCRPTAATDPCIGAFIETFGRRAWRRPLAGDEVQKWTALVASLTTTFDGAVTKALEYVLAGFLQSPNFLYRVEIGEPIKDGPDRRQYTGYEMATRLSYSLWQTTPDDKLLDAAGSGALSTAEGITGQADRLLADPRASAALLRFFSEHLRLGDLTTEYHPKNLKTFPIVSDTFYGALRTEMQMVVADLLASGHNVLDLFTARSTYVDGRLADFYGTTRPAGSGLVRTDLPPTRIGYLTSGAFLAINAHPDSSSPTRRGVYVLQNLLCKTVPPPPPDVNPTLPADTGMVTTRQRLEAHRASPACAGCHALFDPVGQALEHFDAIGAYRDKENGLAIDTSGDLDGVSFQGPDGVAQLLHGSDQAARCLVASAYRYNTGHNVVSEDDGEGAVIDGLASSFAASGNDYRAFMAALVRHPAFRQAIGQY